MDVSTLFQKLIEHKNKLKRLTTSEVNVKNKENVKQDKPDFSLKTSSYKAIKLEECDGSINKDSSKEGELSLFSNPMIDI